MGDISTWSPVDESNTAAPPNGWPEGQAANSVNNCARAMMGGVRRWYDTVTLQIASITASLGTFMPITGGTFTGPITAPQIHSNGTLSASGDISTNAAITAVGNINAGGNLTAIYSGTFGANLSAGGNLSVGYSGTFGANLSVTGDVSVAGAVNCAGRVNAAYYDCDGNRVIDTGSGATVFYKIGNVPGMSMSTVASVYDNNSHTFRNNSAANTFTIDVSGNVNATAQVQGATLYSRSNIDAAANISANGTLSAVGDISTSGVFSGTRLQGGPGASGQLRTYGTSNTVNFRWYTAGTGQLAYRIDETVEKYLGATTNVLDTQYATGGGGPTGAVFGGHDFPGTWYYCFIDYTSDERIKSNIAPTQVDALGILKQIPVDQFDIKPEVAGVFRALRGIHGREVTSSDHIPIGLIAQKLQALIPEAVYVGPQPGDNPLPEDCCNITLPALTPYLIRAVQQLAARVEALERA